MLFWKYVSTVQSSLPGHLSAYVWTYIGYCKCMGCNGVCINKHMKLCVELCFLDKSTFEKVKLIFFEKDGISIFSRTQLHVLAVSMQL